LLYIPPLESLIATTLDPKSSRQRKEAWHPAFPYPWMATVARERSIPSSLAASRMVNMPPRAVASSRPQEPPMQRGFPVMQPNSFFPVIFEYSSIIQAMIWGVV